MMIWPRLGIHRPVTTITTTTMTTNREAHAEWREPVSSHRDGMLLDPTTITTTTTTITITTN
jgi:hypothetical protein